MLAPRIWLWLAIGLVALGCAPAAGRSGGENTGSQAPAIAPKRLRVGILQEPKGWAPWSSTSSSGGAQQTIFLVTRTLTVIADDGSVKPVLAEALPSVQQGTWRIEPDGTMEQTWRIRASARWQDGQPVTADDFLFAWEILSHPLIPNDLPDARNLIAGASSPDPQTLILRFKGTTPLAEQMLFDPYPRHILGELLASGETDRLINHEYWTTSFIGAGPYRVVEWQPGAFIEFAAFPDYVEGRPNIDAITVRFLTDPGRRGPARPPPAAPSRRSSS
jgi:ABC-type transport system substrate-binding protein